MLSRSNRQSAPVNFGICIPADLGPLSPAEADRNLIPGK